MESVGKEILENVKDVVAEEIRHDIEESVSEAAGVKLESYGTPKVNGQTVEVPVVVAAVLDEYDMERMKQKVDTKWLERMKPAILQRLVLKQNPGDPMYGRRRGSTIYFDTDQFKLEYLEGNIVRLTTTVVCDLSPMLDSLTGLRWDLKSCIRDLAGEKRGSAGKLAAG